MPDMTKDPWRGDKWTCHPAWARGTVSGMGSRSQILRTRLRVARAERDVSQAELARAVGVSRQTISSIETGQYCPSTVLALRLADALAVPFSKLFWLEGAHDGSPVGT
jgi:putative transcriptional regulator